MRADTAVRPYAEFIVATKIKSIKPARQRDARWDVERKGRETKVEPPSEVKRVCTGDFGTSARHPPRERIDSLISNSVPREGVAALPYTESLTSAKHASSIKPFPQRDARWDVEHEAPTTRANCQSVNQSKIKVPVARAHMAVRPCT